MAVYIHDPLSSCNVTFFFDVARGKDILCTLKAFLVEVSMVLDIFIHICSSS